MLYFPVFREGGSEHVPLGAPKFDKTSQNSQNVEEFVAGLRFEQRGKLDMEPIDNIKLHNENIRDNFFHLFRLCRVIRAYHKVSP